MLRPYIIIGSLRKMVVQNGADRSALFQRCSALEDTPNIELFVGYEFGNTKMSTQLLKAILSQNPEIQLCILLAFVSYSQHQSIEVQPKTKFTKQKMILVSSQVGEFGIVNIIGWFDPISGLCVGFCFLFWHLVQALMEEKKDD